MGPALPGPDARRGVDARNTSAVRGRGLRQRVHAGAASAGRPPPCGARAKAKDVASPSSSAAVGFATGRKKYHRSDRQHDTQPLPPTKLLIQNAPGEQDGDEW